MWVPRPSHLRDTARAIGKINDGGGPRRLRLVRVRRPEGWFLPSSETTVEVEAASGKVLRLSPEFPVPFFHAWGYRLARRLDLPLASTLDPEDLSFELPVPRWVWRGLPPQKAGQPGREFDATPNVSPSSEWRP
jgi:hypothetical protein